MTRPLSKSLFVLPNLLTSASIFCGIQAIVLCGGARSGSEFIEAALFIAYAMILDTVDGRVARLTGTQSDFGTQLDSLADMVSFGVAPAVLMVAWSLHELGSLGTLCGFLFVAAGAFRLARFNVDVASSDEETGPDRYNRGFSIPSAAGVLVALVIARHTLPTPATSWLAGDADTMNPWSLAALMTALSFLMVSTVPLRSYKGMHWSPPWLAALVATIFSSLWFAITVHPVMALLWLFSVYLVLTFGELVLRGARRALRPLGGRNGRSQAEFPEA